MSGAQNRRRGALIATLIAAAALLGVAAPAPALAAPVLDVDSSHYPAEVAQGKYAQYELTVSNVGPDPTSGDIAVAFSVPAGIEVSSVRPQEVLGFTVWDCSIAAGSQSASCRGPSLVGPVGSGQEACQPFGPCRILVIAKVDSNTPLGSVSPTIEACGGGAAACAGVSDPFDVVPFEFKITNFDGEALDTNGDPATQAGSRPHTAATTFSVNTVLGSDGREFPAEDIRDVTVSLPPGLVGNPQAYPTCTQSQLFGLAGQVQCPPESQLGVAYILFDGFFSTGPGQPRPEAVAVYNMETSKGLPALFAFNVVNTLIQIYPELRTGEDYGLDVTSKNASQTVTFEGVDFTFWGVPPDPTHNALRATCVDTDSGRPCPVSSSAPLRPFISLPTSCVGPVETFLEVTGWFGASASSSFLSHDNTLPVPNPIGNEGCGVVPFDPTIEARPTTNVADAPSGLDVELRVPQNSGEICDPGPPVRCGIASAHLRDTTVTLPEGLVINPSGANGLDGCSLAEFGYTSTDPDGTIHTTPGAAGCPNASKVASAEVDSPLLDHPLRGSAHVADPFANPFNSLLALYITIDDVESGTVVKLAGEVTPDPGTGRLSATFEGNPQLPFETFRLNFFGGAGGALRTPSVCDGDPSTPAVDPYTTEATLTPWTAPDVSAALALDTWAITQGCVNSPAEMPHAPSFDAGTISPIAGAHSPFVVKLRREDGSQNFSAVTVRPPQGLTAKLAGTPACSDADLATAASKSGAGERASPSCPAASEIGKVTAGAGAGPAPYYAHGKVYLAGPYKGAPISLATVIPATAGPFDLGTVVTRIAAQIDPRTAEITAVSDPIPSILQGIPLDVRSVDVALDKPNFSLNPTSCDPMAVSGQITSLLGAVANLSSRFQLGECTSLGFKPKMAIRLKGGTARGKHPQLTAILFPRPGDANIRSVSVAFPRSEFLENAHIRTICTRPDFAADRCPAGAVYGTSTVFTPLLDYPLTGNVYLRSSDNLLPDVVPDLRGPAHQPIRIEAAGRTDSIKGGIRNTFDFFPDAPFTRAILRMQGGNKGLLVNSRNICARTYRAKVRFVGHNGATHTIRPKLKAQCRKKKRRKAKRSSHSRSKRIALAARSSVR